METYNIGTRVVSITTQVNEGIKLGEQIVSEKLASNVNIIDRIKNITLLGNKIKKKDHVLLIFKTSCKNIPLLIEKINKSFFRDKPEITVLDIEAGIISRE